MRETESTIVHCPKGKTGQQRAMPVTSKGRSSTASLSAKSAGLDSTKCSMRVRPSQRQSNKPIDEAHSAPHPTQSMNPPQNPEPRMKVNTMQQAEG